MSRKRQPSAPAAGARQWGLSWQIAPIVLTTAIAHSDPAVAKRACDAMMQMQKIVSDVTHR
ncbi:hypothetical protein [Nodosilinea sp. E11]|uniref:hypothetical protein n=1 Tax=Nodosilinea sp. E11 TaxID=3037479 RepID=UPI002935034F|nr:hypothetical protein [Nodosilinea sp. E11]WOD41613.1 hypothetical protein RRF56_12490 [Nodosilinea sp. E11]